MWLYDIFRPEEAGTKVAETGSGNNAVLEYNPTPIRIVIPQPVEVERNVFIILPTSAGYPLLHDQHL